MPSKSRNGNSPLGHTRLEGDGGFARTELEISKRTPKQSMTSGLIQTPSGAIHAPKRRRKGGGTTTSTPWRIRLSQDAEDDLWYATIGTGTVWQGYHGIEDKLVLEPVPGDYANATGVVDFPINAEKRIQVVSGDLLCLQAKQEGGVIFRKVTSTGLEEAVIGGTTFYEGFYILGKITVNPDDPSLLLKIQRAESNLYTAGLCDSGYYVTGLHPV